MKTTLAIAALAGLASTANAQVAFNLGNLNVGDTPLQMNLNGGSIAPGNYTFATLTTDWLAGPGNPFSNEAIWALTDGTDLGTSTFFVDPGAAPDALGSGAATTLNWGASFDIDYAGGGSLWFNALQTFGGSSATWGNTTLTLFESQPTNTYVPGAPAGVQPAAIDLGVLGAEGDNFVIDTLNSPDLDGDGNGDFDSELGLYDQAGNLVTNNDDGIPGVFGPSLMDVASDTAFTGLGAGEYFIALGGFNVIYDPTNFGAVPDASLGSDGGDYVLTVNGSDVASGSHPELSISWFKFTVVPAPSSFALLGLGGIAAVRRRR